MQSGPKAPRLCGLAREEQRYFICMKWYSSLYLLNWYCHLKPEVLYRVRTSRSSLNRRPEFEFTMPCQSRSQPANRLAKARALDGGGGQASPVP